MISRRDIVSKLSATGMAEVAAARAKRAETLRKLTADPFDLNNKTHVKALKEYTDQFELSSNQMYLYQALSTGLKAYSGSWLVGFFLPIPEFANYFLTGFLYFGIAGLILERFSMTDFCEQLDEMRTVYNWCLKGGNANYSSDIDNTDNLAYPDTQRMVKLMAPLCSTDFMLAWPRVVAQTEESSGIVSNAFSWGYSAWTSASSFFSAAPKTNQDQLMRIRELKSNVETSSLDVGVFAGFERAIKYFVTDTEFRNILKEKLSQPIQSVKEYIPKAIMS